MAVGPPAGWTAHRDRAWRILTCDAVSESVARLVALVDEMVLVEDDTLLEAMRLAVNTLGLLLEPSGAAGLAAIRAHDLPGSRFATVLTGSNVRPEHLRLIGQ
jgi:threonine dehydratase